MIRGLTISILLCAIAAPVSAQTAQEVTVAREAFRSGVAAARAENWDEARSHFQRSYAINQRLSALMNLATAEERGGHLVDAAEHYREYLDRAEDGDANASTIRRTLTALEPRVPRVALTVSGLVDGDEVLIDGGAIPPQLLTTPIPVNPGPHQITVLRSAETVAAVSFQATEGATSTQTLDVPAPALPEPELIIDEPAQTLPDPSESNGVETEVTGSEILDGGSSEPEDSGSVLEAWWFWTLIGVVAVGATVGIVFAASGESASVAGNGFNPSTITFE